MSPILVAGIGNIFNGDDAFGVEVARLLSQRALPDGIELVDFGIRGIDLTYALLDGYEAAVLIDAGPLWHALIADIASRVPATAIAARFHRGLAKVVAETAVRLAVRAVPMRRPGFDTIALSGGCFQNRLLLESVAARLGAAGFACCTIRRCRAMTVGWRWARRPSAPRG